MCQFPEFHSFPGRPWLGLMLGNSRRHWAQFSGQRLLETWDEDNTEPPPVFNSDWPLILASVVGESTPYWAAFPQVQILTLADIPLKGIYPTLGIDRALAVLGAGTRYGWPILVIDAGTALTFTAADADHQLVGGAILPGLGLQGSSLALKTAALPRIEFPPHLPERWATETPGAIQSGIIYTLVAGMRDFIAAWQQQYPQGAMVITGGDRNLLLSYFTKQFQDKSIHPVVDPHLIFRGMAALKTELDG